jgi:hypothetical protein
MFDDKAENRSHWQALKTSQASMLGGKVFITLTAERKI